MLTYCLSARRTPLAKLVVVAIATGIVNESSTRLVSSSYFFGF
ncbi:Retinol dehydrogenase 12, partial [Araneus ventricosus]